MKIVAIVPMKLNNSRLPQKNTKCFSNGRPLCYYILATLLSIKELFLEPTAELFELAPIIPIA